MNKHIRTTDTGDISFMTGGKERLRITKDGKFLVNSIIEVESDNKEDARKIYYALKDFSNQR